ncbi:MAG: glycosyltransferase family A protein [Planctomycetota bacterium]
MTDQAARHPGAALVSVVIPMRNGGAFIGPTLASVLTQEGCALEVVVVNDGSTDGSDRTVEAVDDARVRMIAGPCEGIAASVNAGLAAARGAYVVRCDADDLLPAGRLAWQAAFLRAHDDYAAVCGSFRTVSDKGRPLAVMRTGDEAQEITQELWTGKTRTHYGTFMVRRGVLNELGGVRPYFKVAEDIDLQLRIGTAHRVWYDPRQSYDYRLHGDSSTHNEPSPAREFLTETARAFARQRAAGQDDDLDKGAPPAVPDGGGAAMDVDRHAQGMLLGEAWRHHRAGRRSAAWSAGWRACWRHPASWSAWRSFLMLWVKRSGRGLAPPRSAAGGAE